jgi:hypothetical protein
MDKLYYHDRKMSIKSDSLILILFTLALFMLSLGISGIIETMSPTAYSTFKIFAESIFLHIQFHILILYGALALIVSIWFGANRKL